MGMRTATRFLLYFHISFDFFLYVLRFVLMCLIEVSIWIVKHVFDILLDISTTLQNRINTKLKNFHKYAIISSKTCLDYLSIHENSLHDTNPYQVQTFRRRFHGLACCFESCSGIYYFFADVIFRGLLGAYSLRIMKYSYHETHATTIIIDLPSLISKIYPFMRLLWHTSDTKQHS